MVERAQGGKGPDHIPKKPVIPKDKKVKPFVADKNKLHKFGSMEFSDIQWKKFMANLMNMMMQQIKEDEKRMKKASERLKHVAEGDE